MTNFANNQIQSMKPYNPPLENRRGYNGMLLDFNERTIPVSKNVTKALQKFATQGKVRLYPEYGDLCEKIAEYACVKPDQIMITNGSDQGIDLIFRTFTQKGENVIIPSPSFAMFYQCAEVVGNNIIMPEYEKDLSFPLNEVLDLIDKDIRLVVICNPNNPTGTLVSFENIEKIVKASAKAGAMVYTDEAYFEYSSVTAASLIDRYPNLIITRTFSKAFGLSSLRIGYVISQKPNIDEVLKVRGPYDVNMAAVVAAGAALGSVPDTRLYVYQIMTKAKPMIERFFEEKGIKYFPSAANFILFKPDDQQKMFEALKENGALTRPRKGVNIDGTIRLTIGTVKQMKKFIEIYNSINYA